MCGICGVVYSDQGRKVEERRLLAMMKVLEHRGPDDSGSYRDGNAGLGHQRLSIIDLSASGHQPMSSEDGHSWITYNGEIYNYLELREQLIAKGYRFKSSSDTEVILHLYQEEGARCVEKLNGMFAFAIWNSRSRTLFAARDRFGIKPFYYASTKDGFIFASEIKSLLASNLIQAQLNPEGLADYVTLQVSLGEKTLFRNIQKLLPGHTLLLRPSGKVQTRRYWELPTTLDSDHTEDYFEHELRRLLEDAVRLQLRSDVPVGAYLSGGLDSSTIACLASGLLENKFKTFSGGFKTGPQYDETRYARIAAKRARSEHFEIFPGPRDFVESMPKLIYHMDEPVSGPGLFPQYFVSRLASRKVKVVLGGQGGDEIFGGYTRYLVAYLEQCLKGGIAGTHERKKFVVTFDSILPNLRQLAGYEPMLKEFWQGGLFEPEDSRYFRLIDRGHEIRALINPDFLPPANQYSPFESYRQIFHSSRPTSYISKMTNFDLKTQLPGLLQVEDRASMAASLESRVPLLDHRIAELVASMPPMVKYKGGRSKHIFRQAIRHVVPAEIYNRTDKMGFPVPLSDWLTNNRGVRDFTRETLLGRKARAHGLLKTDLVPSLLDSERPFGRGIWGLLCLELWQGIFLDGKGP